jgi:NAD(P)-dependent dehydrogenase (short-subunit alcohol dehydrogenase family)
MNFEGKVAVITGGASGIGRATALALARRGVNITIADIDEKNLEDVQAQIGSFGVKSLGIRCDVTSDEDVKNLAEQVISVFGRVDILMNNAGIWFRKEPADMTMVDWEHLLGVNLFGVIRGVTFFLPHMIKQGGGHIVNTASAAGLFSSPGGESIAYTTSKFGVIGLSEALALNGRSKGIRVSVLCPGLVRTNMLKSNLGVVGEGALALAMDPEPVADMVVEAIKNQKFLILTEPRFKDLMLLKAQDMDSFLEGRTTRRPNKK